MVDFFVSIAKTTSVVCLRFNKKSGSDPRRFFAGEIDDGIKGV